MKRRTLWMALAGAVGTMLAVGGPACADIVHLKSGRKIEGRVTVDGDRLVIEMAFGSITISRDRVERVEARRSDLDEYERRLKALPDDATAAETLFELGEWCVTRGLPRRAELCYQKAVRIDPDHEGARTALGYVRHEGRWLTYDQMMAATGHLKHQGKWVTAEEKAELERLEVERLAERERKLDREAERAVRQATAERLRAERDKLEAERVLLEAERRKLLQEGHTLEALQWRARFGWPIAPVILVPRHRHHEPEDDKSKDDDKKEDAEPKTKLPERHEQENEPAHLPPLSPPLRRKPFSPAPRAKLPDPQWLRPALPLVRRQGVYLPAPPRKWLSPIERQLEDDAKEEQQQQQP